MRTKFLIILSGLLMFSSVSFAQYKPRKKSQSITTNVISIDSKLRKDLEKQALARVQLFQDNCAKIGNKQYTGSKQLLITTTMDLFASPKSIIQVSDSRKNVTKKTVNSYLLRLSVLPYEIVEIVSSDFHIASTDIKASAYMNAKKGEKGWYEGTVSVLQRFTGRRGEFEYTDVVNRNFTVYMKRLEITEGTTIYATWQVLIGDIEVQVVSVG